MIAMLLPMSVAFPSPFPRRRVIYRLLWPRTSKRAREDYAQWYLDVIKAAKLADYSPVSGCMVDPARRVCDLGGDPAAARSAVQGDRARQRLFSAADPA